MSKRFALCCGDLCAFQLGLLSSPLAALNEVGCLNHGIGPSGFGWHTEARECAEKLCKRMDGQMAVVTGANSGVGLETTRVLFELGATVIMACRSAERAEVAKKDIEGSAKGIGGKPGSILILPLDTASLKSVEAFAARINEMVLPLTLLVCNAGIMACGFSLTEDGLEYQYQVNYLSHHYLTLLLADKLKAAPAARVVNVSSISHAWVPFPGGCCSSVCCFGPFDLSGKRYPAQSGACCAYEPFEDYSYSKAAQVVMSKELSRRLFNDANVIVVSLEPGMSVDSKIGEASACLSCVFNYTCLPVIVGAIVGKSLPRMASTVIYAALADGIAGETQFIPLTFLPLCPPTRKLTSPLATRFSTLHRNRRRPLPQCQQIVAPRPCQRSHGAPRGAALEPEQ